MCALVAVLLICAIVNAIRTLSSLSDRTKESLIHKMVSIVKAGLTLNIVYYVFCMYEIIKAHEGEIDMILSGDALVTTKTHIPMILQIVVLVGAILLRKHWNNALYGNGKPINLFGGSNTAGAGFSGGKQSTYQQQNTYTSTQNTSQQNSSTQNTQTRSNKSQFEMETVEPLKRYKELFDDGVLTEEEFLAKKKEIMSHNAYSEQQNTSDQQQPASNTENQSQDAEKASSRICYKCGYPLTSSQQVCPHCGTHSADEKEAEPHPMKWYKFLVYFSLFASAVLNAITAIMYFTGASYGGLSDLVYDAFPGLQAIDLCCGAAFVGLAIMALRTRSALYWNKRKGPKLLCTLYILNAVVSVLYVIVASVVTEKVLFDGSIVISLITSIVMAIVNHIYFKKRQDIFVY